MPATSGKQARVKSPVFVRSYTVHIISLDVLYVHLKSYVHMD